MNQSIADEEGQLESLVARLADEYVERIDPGENPSVDEFARRHPEHATAIREVLSCLQLVRLSSSGSNGQAQSDLASTESLGDFRLLREVGRGGMGVVYEAEQVSLRRRVALKVLPFASTLDPRHLQRFRNEAHAAAQLHHTNIVPVYAVGAERGVHFYAMQFINGRSLGDLVLDLRRQKQPAWAKIASDATHVKGQSSGSESVRAVPETAEAKAASATEVSVSGPAFFQMVARLGVQAAEALEYAHQRGVIHRDVKPANLLIDETGNLWVADFGLAQVQGDARLTTTGDLLGTLRYMSPEQALGQRGQADHRADVYSLGATLYELLTLEPVFAGNDQKELLRQIAVEEPRALRKINSSIPAELQIIVLKALAKNVSERYASAGDLADDLRRFLEDKPIKARRPGIGVRLRKWSRRHRPAVWAAAAVAIIAAALAVGVGIWYLQERAARQTDFVRDVEARWLESNTLANQAELSRDKPAQWNALLTGSRSALERAEQLLSGRESETPQELRSRIQELRASLEAEERDRQLFVEWEQIRAQHATVDASDISFGHQMSSVHFTNAFARYGIRVGDQPIDVRERILARQPDTAFRLLAALNEWFLWTPNRQEMTWLLSVLAKVDSDPWRASVRSALAGRDRTKLGKLATEVNVAEQLPEFLAPLGATFLNSRRREDIAWAANLLERTYTQYPGNFWVAHFLGLSLTWSEPPRLDDAVRYFTAAVAIRPESSAAWLNFGVTLRRQKKFDLAVSAHQKAIELQPGFAAAYNNLASVYRDQGEFVAAVAACDKAIKLEPDFASPYNSRGVALHELDRDDEAIASYQRAIELKPDFAMPYNNLGIIYQRKRSFDDAVAAFLKAIEFDPVYANAYLNLGSVYRDMKKFDDSAIAYRKAVELRPGHALSHYQLANTLRRQGKFEEALATFETSIRLDPTDYRAHRTRATILRDLGRWQECIAAHREAVRLDPGAAIGHYNLANALREVGAMAECVATYRQAIRLQPDYPDAYCNLGHCLKLIGEFNEALTVLKRGHELGLKKQGWNYPSAQWVRDAERLVKLESQLPAILNGEKKPADSKEKAEFATFLYYKRHYVSAAQFFRQSFTFQLWIASAERIMAASAAAQAGGGAGMGGDNLDRQERAQWRQQALKWLRAELMACTNRLGVESAEDRMNSVRTWRQICLLKDFTGVRDPAELATLPETERIAWKELWSDVDKMIVIASAPRNGKSK